MVNINSILFQLLAPKRSTNKLISKEKERREWRSGDSKPWNRPCAAPTSAAALRQC
jgi:hypothetical protein